MDYESKRRELLNKKIPQSEVEKMGYGKMSYEEFKKEYLKSRPEEVEKDLA
jgi:hypothetical protein